MPPAPYKCYFCLPLLVLADVSIFGDFRQERRFSCRTLRCRCERHARSSDHCIRFGQLRQSYRRRFPAVFHSLATSLLTADRPEMISQMTLRYLLAQNAIDAQPAFTSFTFDDLPSGPVIRRCRRFLWLPQGRRAVGAKSRHFFSGGAGQLISRTTPEFVAKFAFQADFDVRKSHICHANIMRCRIRYAVLTPPSL